MIRKTLVLLLFCTVTLYATVTLTNEKLKYDDFSIHYFYDESTSLDINDIEKIGCTNVIPNQFTEGYNSGTSWFKIDITNQSDIENFVLYFTEPLWSKLDLYTKVNGSWHIQKNGLDISLKERSLNLDLVAEGVETLEQANFLMSKNCMCVQGHYYFHALSAEEIHTILTKEKII